MEVLFKKGKKIIQQEKFGRLLNILTPFVKTTKMFV
jgi:hypothetical protein